MKIPPHYNAYPCRVLSSKVADYVCREVYFRSSNWCWSSRPPGQLSPEEVLQFANPSHHNKHSEEGLLLQPSRSPTLAGRSKTFQSIDSSLLMPPYFELLQLKTHYSLNCLPAVNTTLHNQSVSIQSNFHNEKHIPFDKVDTLYNGQSAVTWAGNLIEPTYESKKIQSEDLVFP